MANITDPEVINRLAADAMSEPAGKMITTSAPSDTKVYLPGGFIRADGTLVKTAEVRELTGQDEEALYKTSSPGARLLAVLQRGLVSLGDEPVSQSDLDMLLSGDREEILIGIRKATFGSAFNIMAYCSNCGDTKPAVVDLDTDIERRELENPLLDRQFEVETRKGTIVVGLPNGVTQKKLFLSEDRTTAELVTLTLAGCVLSIDGVPSIGPSSVLSLGIADREAILAELAERSPGPRLGEVKTKCGACAADITVALGLFDFFRF